MPAFTIESTRFVPEHRVRVFEAETVAQACRQAIEDDDWSTAKRSPDTPGETHVTAIWRGSKPDMYEPLMEVPSQYRQKLSRKAEHFPVLRDLLRILASDGEEIKRDIAYWRRAAGRAITKADAILSGARDPVRTSRPEEGAREHTAHS